MPARLPVNAPETAGSLRNKTPDLTLADVKARQASKIREIGKALITTGFVSLDAVQPGGSSRLSTRAPGSLQRSSAGC
jgi:hypothetical protein